MSETLNPIILIPARLAATRLPNKPLADIAGKPMILYVVENALLSKVGRVVVAAGDQEIYDVVCEAGFEAVLTDPDLPSGSDRIYAALQKIDSDKKHNLIINLQGDLPLFDPTLLSKLANIFKKKEGVDIATPLAPLDYEKDHANPNVVKAAFALEPGKDHGKVLYFSRALIPYGDGPFYHHIGIYAYKRQALETYVSLPPSPLEKREKLEQLRALEAGMHIEGLLVDQEPYTVDTPEDLERVRKVFMSSR